MPNLEIKIYPNPVLRKKAKPIESVGPEEVELLDEMAQTMYGASGVGLAAPQVGIDKQLIVVDTGEGLLKLANPKVIEVRGRQTMEEGCLSLPGMCVKVKRANKIKVEALNENNEKVILEKEGLTSVALQHEIDHLFGILIVDKVGFIQKLRLHRKLKNLKKEVVQKCNLY